MSEGPGQYGAGQYGAPQQPVPPRRSWFARHKVLTALGVLAVLVIGISVSSGGGKTTTAASTTPVPVVVPTSHPAAPSSAPPAATPAPAPAAAKPGVISSDQGFDLNSVKLADDGAGDFGGTARITNSSGSDIKGGLFKITILKGTAVVGTLEGALPNTASGKTVSVDTLSQDKYAAGTYTEQLQIDGTY